MLAQAVVSSYVKVEGDGIHRGQLTVTGVSPCPYATYLNYHHLDDEGFSPSARLRMKNGKWQELEVLEDLRHAGFKLRFTGSNQQTVHVGKALITGRPDGLVTVDDREDLLEIKAMSLSMFTKLTQKGIKAFPGYECQVQLYLASEELKDLKGCWFYVKHKDSCKPYDIFVEKEEGYSRSIIEAMDEIVLGKTKVARPTERLPICTYCRHKLHCWKSELFDTSGIKTLTKEELVQKWLEARFHLEIGKELNEEARVLIKEYLGASDILYLEGESSLLEAKRIVQHRQALSEGKFVEKYGAAALASILQETTVEQIRITCKE